MKHLIQITLRSLVLSIICFIPVTSIHAGENPLQSLSAQDLINRFAYDAEHKIITAEHTHNRMTGFFKENTQEKNMKVDSYLSKGFSKKKDMGSELYSGKSRLLSIENKPEGAVKHELELIIIDDVMYVRFFTDPLKEINTKWIPMSLNEYLELGVYLDEEAVFGMGIMKNRADNELPSSRYSDSYKFYPHKIDDGYKEKNSYRFNLEFKKEALVSTIREYIKETKKSNQNSYTSYLESLLLNDSFVNELIDESYVSLWFDKKTLMPIRHLSVITKPAISSISGPIMMVSEDRWEKINKPIKLKKPTKILTVSEFKNLIEYRREK